MSGRLSKHKVPPRKRQVQSTEQGSMHPMCTRSKKRTIREHECEQGDDLKQGPSTSDQKTHSKPEYPEERKNTGKTETKHSGKVFVHCHFIYSFTLKTNDPP